MTLAEVSDAHSGIGSSMSIPSEFRRAEMQRWCRARRLVGNQQVEQCDFLLHFWSSSHGKILDKMTPAQSDSQQRGSTMKVMLLVSFPWVLMGNWWRSGLRYLLGTHNPSIMEQLVGAIGGWVGGVVGLWFTSFWCRISGARRWTVY